MKRLALLLLFVVCHSSALTLEQVKATLKENVIPQDSVEMNLRVTVKAMGVYQQTDIYIVKKGTDKGYTEIKSSFLKQRSIVNGKKMKVVEKIETIKDGANTLTTFSYDANNRMKKMEVSVIVNGHESVVTTDILRMQKSDKVPDTLFDF